MVITNISVEISIPYAHSLKERRAIINSMKERLRKFNLSIIDVSGEYAREALLAVVFASHNETLARQILQKIDEFIYKNFPQIDFELTYEFL